MPPGRVCMMKITDAQLKQIYAHAADTYPGECFGFLAGTDEGRGTVRQAVRGANVKVDRPDRFEMDPEEFVQVAQKAEEAGWGIIGFYHSHPDWPPVPSQADLDGAWEGSYCLIVSVHEGRPFNTAVWLLAEEGPRRFVAQPLEVLDERS